MSILTGAKKIPSVSFKSTRSVKYYSSVKSNRNNKNITSVILNNLQVNQGVTITEDELYKHTCVKLDIPINDETY